MLLLSLANGETCTKQTLKENTEEARNEKKNQRDSEREKKKKYATEIVQ